MLVGKAIELYGLWVATGREAPLMPFLRKQLAAGRGDVLHGFFKHLTREPRERTGAVVREITAMREWRRVARRALAHRPTRHQRGVRRKAS